MTVPPPEAEVLTTAELQSLADRFRGEMERSGKELQAAVEACADHLAAAVAAAAEIAVRHLASFPAGPDADAASRRAWVLAATRELDAYGTALRAHLERDPLGADADERDAILRKLTGLIDGDAWSGTVDADAPGTDAGPDPELRPGLMGRVAGRLRRKGVRTVHTGALARYYALARVPRRLEDAWNATARLHAEALMAVRQQHRAVLDAFWATYDAEARDADAASPPAVDPATDAADAAITRLRGSVDRVKTRIRQEVETAADGFRRGVFARGLRLDDDRADTQATRAGRRLAETLDRWRDYEAALRTSTETEITSASTVAGLAGIAASTGTDLDGTLDVLLRRPLRELSDGLKQLAGGITSDAEGAAPAWLEAIRGQVDALFDRCGKGVVTDLVPALEEHGRTFVERLESLPGSLSEDTPMSVRPLEGVPDEPEELDLRDAPLVEMLAATCTGALPRWAEKAIRDAGVELHSAGAEVRRLWQAISFNLAAARQAVRDGETEELPPGELAAGVLERSAAQLEEMLEQAARAVEPVIAELERRTSAEATEARAAIRDREFMRIHSEIVEEAAGRQVASGMAAAARITDAAVRHARRALEGLTRMLRGSRDWGRRQLGVARVERDDLIEALDASRLDEDRGVELPAIYRQLFAIQPLDEEWDELLVPREEELETMRRALERWGQGEAACVAVIGEKGSGKTTLLQLARTRLMTGLPVTGDALGQNVAGRDALLEVLNALFETDADDLVELQHRVMEAPPVAIFLEDAHHLFLRAIGGFDALRAFLGFLSATRRRVFWVITMDEYGWRYLDRALEISQYFPYLINTTDVPAAKLEQAVMARHQVSGFGLSIPAASEEERESSRWVWLRRRRKGELSRRELARRDFFHTLSGIAEGNIFLALFYWTRSIREVENHTLVLEKPAVVPVDALGRLPLASLHTIAAIILHGGLAPAEHARVFQLSEEESRLHLLALADAHLLFPTEDDDYKINRVLYRPFVRLLKDRNIL